MIKNSVIGMKINNQLFNYINAIFSFENNLRNDNGKSFHKKDEGYLIDLKEYQNLKNNIYYDILKEYIDNKNDLFDKKVKQLLKSNNSKIDVPSINHRIFKNSSDLVHSIKNKNEFILISKDLWKILSNNKMNNKSYINYYLENFILSLNIDNKKINFINNNYILNENSYISNELNNLIDAIIEYYNFENNNLTNEKDIGYLIDKKWIEEWKTKIYYNDIKEKYFKNHKSELNIKTKIIIFLKNLNYQYNISPIQSYTFDNLDNLEDFIHNNSLTIVTTNFFNKLKKKTYNNQFVDFSIINNKITIYLNGSSLSFQLNNNNIYSYYNNFLNNEKNMDVWGDDGDISKINQKNKDKLKLYLNLLILFFKTNESIKSNMKRKIKDFKNIVIEEEDYYLVKAEWINIFKSLFLYKLILPILINNKIDILHKNIDDNNLQKIIKEIPNDYKNQLFSLDKSDIKHKLCNKNLYKIFSDSFILDEEKYTYFSHCGIIAPEILFLLKEIEIDIIKNYTKIRKVKCLFLDENAFIYIGN